MRFFTVCVPQLFLRRNFVESDLFLLREHSFDLFEAEFGLLKVVFQKFDEFGKFVFPYFFTEKIEENRHSRAAAHGEKRY